jgi:hypothetical protein
MTNEQKIEFLEQQLKEQKIISEQAKSLLESCLSYTFCSVSGDDLENKVIPFSKFSERAELFLRSKN